MNPFALIPALLNLMRVGQQVKSNPTIWKTAGWIALVLAGLLQLAKAMGYDLDGMFTPDAVATIADVLASVLGVFGGGAVMASTPKLGLLPAVREPADTPAADDN